MKKTILSAALVLTMAFNFQAQAAVGGVVALAGGGATVALAGLGVSGVSFGLFMANAYTLKSETVGFFTGYVGFLLGLVILDGEEGQEIQFKKLNQNEITQMNLSPSEALAYNDNTEELTAAFKLVSSELSNESSVEVAAKLWSQQEEILGKDAINGVRKVIANALKK